MVEFERSRGCCRHCRDSCRAGSENSGYWCHGDFSRPSCADPKATASKKARWGQCRNRRGLSGWYVVGSFRRTCKRRSEVARLLPESSILHIQENSTPVLLFHPFPPFLTVEYDVIVLSLTRSTQSFVEHDVKHRMGVFGQPKRSNVAMTRAEFMFIVVSADKNKEGVVYLQFYTCVLTVPNNCCRSGAPL